MSTLLSSAGFISVGFASAPAATSHLVSGCVAACVAARVVEGREDASAVADVVAGLVDGIVGPSATASWRRLRLTRFFDAGRLVGLVVAVISEAMVMLLTWAESISRTLRSRRSSG